MGKSKNNGTNFLVQGSILAVASIISRIIGLVYRIPLNNILGDVGISYYACAFDVYNVILIISSYSLPQAVSKTVSAKAAKGQYRSVYQVLKGALLFALVSGIVASLVVFFGAEFFTGTLLKTPYSVFALKILGPALVVVAVLGVLRGFFQGLGTMMPSAISQIIEQIVNAIISVWAAYVLYRYGTKIGAVLGDAEERHEASGLSLAVAGEGDDEALDADALSEGRVEGGFHRVLTGLNLGHEHRPGLPGLHGLGEGFSPLLICKLRQCHYLLSFFSSDSTTSPVSGSTLSGTSIGTSSDTSSDRSAKT